MRKVWAIIRREVVERVRTKAFIISTLLFPFLIGILMVLPAFLISRSTGTKAIALVDATSDGLGAQIETALYEARIGKGPEALPKYAVQRFKAADANAIRDSLVPFTGLSRKRAGGWDGILVVSDSTVPSGKAAYYGANVASLSDMRELEQAMRPVVIAKRLQGIGVDLATVMKSVQGIDLSTTKVSNGKLTSESGSSTFALAYAMGFILYLSLLLFGTQVMTSIIEEKSSRIVEVLASSLTPFQMMLGKVVGVGCVALIQLGIWAAIAASLANNQARLMHAFGIEPGAGGGTGFALPAMPLDLMVVFFLFFALGFLLYAAAYAAVGAMCSTVQDSQQMQMPVMVFVLAGFFSTFALMRDPNSPTAHVLTFVPMLTPFVVPLRYSITPLSPLELAGSLTVTVLGMLLIVWVASRIYRVGILSYGKKATLRDMVRWVRTA